MGMDNHLAACAVRCRCPLKDLPREKRELQHVPQKCDLEGGVAIGLGGCGNWPGQRQRLVELKLRTFTLTHTIPL